MTAIAPRRRRHVVMPLRRSAGAAASPVAVPRGRLLAMLVLIATLPMFAQSFHYLNELPPPYYLSKAWPVLVFPLTVYALLRLDLPGNNLLIVMLAYMLGFTPLVSMIQLGNGFFDALTTTVKAWPFTYYFAFSGLLALLALPARRVEAAFLGFGAGTFVLLVAIWVTAPTSWYVTNPEDGKLLQYDMDRGYRIYMSMFFGMVFIFYLARSFVLKRSILHGLAIPVAFLILTLIYKQRTAIGAAFLVACFGMAMSLPRRPRQIILGLALIIGMPILAFAAWDAGLVSGAGWDTIQEKLGGSLSVRQNSSALALRFLGDHTERWMFGVGATTRFGSVTLADIFGYDQFFVADLGWLGVIFEYGLVGAAFILALHVWGFVYMVRTAHRTMNPLALALSDYALFLILTSAVYSLVFVPGEFGVVLALAVYLGRALEAHAEPSPRGRAPRPDRPPFLPFEGRHAQTD